jgi:hypothetical protein
MWWRIKPMFNPQEHLIYLPRKVKDPVTGQWSTRLDEYLEVKFRVLMFRQAHPSGVIETEEVCVDLEKGSHSIGFSGRQRSLGCQRRLPLYFPCTPSSQLRNLLENNLNNIGNLKIYH